MAEKKELKQESHHEEPNLKGTFISVMFVGGFIVISWLVVFIIFLMR